MSLAPDDILSMRLAVAAVAMHALITAAPSTPSEELAEVADAHAIALITKVVGSETPEALK